MIFLSMTSIFCMLSIVGLYFLLSKQEDKLKVNNEEYRFGILKTSLIISLFFSSILFIGAIAIFIIKSVLMQIIIFLITGVGFVILRKNLVVNIEDSDKNKQQGILDSANIVEYKESKLSSIGYGFLGVFWSAFWLFLFNYNLFLSLLGTLVGCGLLIKMIINSSVFKVKLFSDKLEYRFNFLKTVIIDFEDIGYIKMVNNLVGSKSIELTIYKSNYISSQKKEIKRKMKITNLKNKIKFIKDLVKRIPKIEFDEEVEGIIKS